MHVGEYVQGGVATYIKSLLSTNFETDNLILDEYLILANKKSEHEWTLGQDRIFYYDYERKPQYIFKAIKHIHRVIKLIKPDIIYCHSTWAGVFTRIPFLFFRRSYKVIYNAHGWSFCRDCSKYKKYLYATIERILSWETDVIINVSKSEYNTAVRYGISAKKMQVLYSGVNEMKSEANQDVGFDEQQINMLFVGRFDKPKGLDLLLQVYENINRKDLHLYVIGDSVLDDCLNKEKYDDANITYLGWIDHDKVKDYYNACDVVIMPSRWEAFGLVAIEAMSCKKPVIVSNRGALPELIENGRSGFIFDLNNLDTLNYILNSIDKIKLKLMGLNAKKIFDQNFTLEKMINKTHLIYKKLC